MRVRRVGVQAVLLELPDAERVAAWRAELWRRRESGELAALDIVPGAGTILLDGVTADTAEAIRAWPPPDPVKTADQALTVQIPTRFDGDDLADVAQLWGVDVPQAVARLAGAALRVAFCGFAPGFAYLSGLPPQWAVPRLTAPRPRVPAGAVALAGGYAGIYPTASPGGWRLVGRTSVTLFDVHREPPALLPPGTHVRLVPA